MVFHRPVPGKLSKNDVLISHIMFISIIAVVVVAIGAELEKDLLFYR